MKVQSLRISLLDYREAVERLRLSNVLGPFPSQFYDHYPIEADTQS